MGILSDLLTAANQGTLADRHVIRELEGVLAKGDFAYPAAYSPINEVQGIAVHSGTVSSGTFTLTLAGLTGAVATSALNHNAVAATIQTAIDTSAAGVTGYVAGHVAITGGPLTTTPLVVTYSGASVAGRNIALLTGDGASLVGGGTLGAITETTAGGTARAAWALLNVLGIITSAPPEQGEVPSAPTVGLGRGSYPYNLSAETVKWLIEEASYDDGGTVGIKSTLLTALEY